METQTIGENHLQDVISSNQYVVVMYSSLICEVCASLLPAYTMLSKNELYTDVLFLQIDSESTPVAKQVVDAYAAPLIVAYKNGEVAEGHAVYSADGMVKMLDHLLGESDSSHFDCCSDH